MGWRKSVEHLLLVTCLAGCAPNETSDRNPVRFIYRNNKSEWSFGLKTGPRYTGISFSRLFDRTALVSLCETCLDYGIFVKSENTSNGKRVIVEGFQPIFDKGGEANWPKIMEIDLPIHR